MTKKHKYPKWVVIFMNVVTLGIVALYSYEDKELDAVEETSRRLVNPEKMDLQGTVMLPKKVRKNVFLALFGKKERAEQNAAEVNKTLEVQKDGTIKDKT